MVIDVAIGDSRARRGRVALGPLVLLDHVRLQLVEEQLVEEDVVRHVRRPSQPSAVLVVEEDRLEARPVPVEKELVLGAVEELRSLAAVAEQRVWMTFEDDQRRLEVLAADVDPQTSILLHVRCRRRRQPASHSTYLTSILPPQRSGSARGIM